MPRTQALTELISNLSSIGEGKFRFFDEDHNYWNLTLYEDWVCAEDLDEDKLRDEDYVFYPRCVLDKDGFTYTYFDAHGETYVEAALQVLLEAELIDEKTFNSLKN
jgi:hypothetical protein